MIKAIETRYAGCRFRSRLEARWAVCFDAMGLEWEYEPQGFLLTERMMPWWGNEYPEEVSYLPDFYLPDCEVYAEVKGSLTVGQTQDLFHRIGAISTDNGGGCGFPGAGNGGYGYSVVVLGNIPKWNNPRYQTQLHMHKGTMCATPWLGDPILRTQPCAGVPIADDADGWNAVGGKDFAVAVAHWLTNGFPWQELGWPGMNGRGWFEMGYDAARSARFEHGESG